MIAPHAIARQHWLNTSANDGTTSTRLWQRRRGETLAPDASFGLALAGTHTLAYPAADDGRSDPARGSRALEAHMISGTTTLIAHLGYPTAAFKAPMIYNPYFEKKGIDAVVVPMGVKTEDYPAFLKSLFRLSNIRGALVTMPHKVTTLALLDEVTPTARIAGSCNAILRRSDGSLLGDMFDGAGFVRGVERSGRALAGTQAL